jgi:DNA-binding transcriptional LysR family regulator
MAQFKRIDIRRLDGRLLLVFRELLRRRRASDVAEHLGLTQSAISHSLSRLRDLFEDPLFVRRSHGLEPTRRALELGPRVEHLVDLAGAVLLRSGGFDPATSERRFTIAVPQFVLATVGADLLSLIRRQAPGTSIAFKNMSLGEATEALRSGEIDAAIGRFDNPLPGLAKLPLYSDRYCGGTERTSLAQGSHRPRRLPTHRVDFRNGRSGGFRSSQPAESSAGCDTRGRSPLDDGTDPDFELRCNRNVLATTRRALSPCTALAATGTSHSGASICTAVRDLADLRTGHCRCRRRLVRSERAIFNVEAASKSRRGQARASLALQQTAFGQERTFRQRPDT